MRTSFDFLESKFKKIKGLNYNNIFIQYLFVFKATIVQFQLMNP